MREILFRGKCNEVGKYNGQWIEGFYGEDDGKPIIARSTDHGLIGYFCEPDSIGQYTGLTDKNGRKIFEGDIIHLEYSQVFFGGVYFGEYTAEVSYKEGCFITDGINNGDEIETPLSGFNNDEVEIIGNIHDNPELLGGESDG